jgi:hypothetical protein
MAECQRQCVHGSEESPSKIFRKKQVFFLAFSWYTSGLLRAEVYRDMVRHLFWGCTGVLLLTALSVAPLGIVRGDSMVEAPNGAASLATRKPSAQSSDASKTKVITRLHRLANEPVGLIEVWVKGRPIELGDHPATFQANDDWLKGLVLRFQNASSKPISSVELHVSLRRPHAAGNVIDFTLKFGQTPGVNQLEGGDILAPGQTADLSISEKWYDRAQRVLGRGGSPSLGQIEQADVELGYVYFDDGTAWHAGSLLRPDPDHPGKYVPMGRQDQQVR